MQRILILALLLLTTRSRAAEQVYDVVVYGGTARRSPRRCRPSRGQVGRDRQPRQAPRRTDQRRPGLDRHRQEGSRSAGLPASSITASGSTTRSRRPGSGKRRKVTATRARRDQQWSATGSARCGSSSRTSPKRIFDDWIAEYEIPSSATRGSTARTASHGRHADHDRSPRSTAEPFRGKMFIDATYEGDLMAAAGVSYTSAARRTASTGKNGTASRTGVLHHRATSVSPKPIDPYVVPGDPTSGLLPAHQRRSARAKRRRATTACRRTASACA